MNSVILDFLKVLCDDSRLSIIEYLKDGKRTQNEITNHLKKSQSRVSQHLKMLTQIKIVDTTQDGGKNFYYIKDMKIFKFLRMILSFATGSSDDKSKFTQSLDLLDLLF